MLAEQFSNVAVQVHSLPAERERPSYSTFQPTLALPVSLVSHTAGPQGSEHSSPSAPSPGKPMLLAGATLGQAIWGGRRVKGMPGSALSGPLREDRDCSQEQRLRRELTSAVQKGASSLHPSPTLKGPRTSCAAWRLTLRKLSLTPTQCVSWPPLCISCPLLIIPQSPRGFPAHFPPTGLHSPSLHYQSPT